MRPLIRTTICLDFDGVIHKRTGEWMGPTVFNGDLIPGAQEGIDRMRGGMGYRVLVHSARCNSSDAAGAIEDYLGAAGIAVDGVVALKPLANVYVDDRAVRFSGDWLAAVADIEAEIGRQKRMMAR